MAILQFNDGLTTVTVAAPGAAAGATSIPVNALPVRLYHWQSLTFTGGHVANLTADVAVGATSIPVSALANTLNAGDTAPSVITLINGQPSPGNRFANWVTHTKPVGDSVARQSDGALSAFVYRTDYGASFELPYIPVVKVQGERLTDYADRLIAWLLQGGQCAVTPEDVDGNNYATCGLMPGTTPELAFTDRVNLEYTLRLSVINLAASPTRMVCHYV